MRRIPGTRTFARAAGDPAVRAVGLGVAVGLLAGVAACGFLLALEPAVAAARWLVGGSAELRPLGEPAWIAFAQRPWNPLWAVLLPSLGGLVSGIVVCTFAPEAEGHGTDAMIRAFHRAGGAIRARVPFVKAVASIAVLATGGSAGREGPIIQMGAGIGSAVATRWGLCARERRILLLAGAAAGVGAIFRSPLGGSIVAIEVLYKEDFEAEALVPCLVASVTGYALFSHFWGHEPIFGLARSLRFTDVREIPFYVLLGLASAALGVFFVRVFRGTRSLFSRSAIPPMLRPAAGGLLVGVLGLLIPQVLGTGWGEVQSALLGRVGAGTLLLVALAKIVSTSLTVGSGGSGGVFGPSLFIGGFFGGALGTTLHSLFPDVAVDPSSYVLVGMASFFAGVANAPIGALVMTLEMTGSYGLVAPLMLVSVIALVCTRDWSLYEHQVRSRFDSPAHRSDLVRDALAEIRTGEVADRLPIAPTPAPADLSIEKIQTVLGDEEAGGFLLVEGKNGALFVVEPEHLVSAGPDPGRSGLVAVDVAVPIPIVRREDNLRRALARMLRAGVDRALVASEEESDRTYRVLSIDAIEAEAEAFLARERAFAEVPV